MIPEIGKTLNDAENLEGHRVFYALQDSYRMTGSSGALIDCVSMDIASITNTDLAKAGHRDHCQPIPPQPVGCFNQQFAAAEIEALRIDGCTFYSPWSQMQGVFSLDGFIRYGIITNNSITTASQHKIAVVVMDGMIANNLDDRGIPVPVALYPLKIAGKLPGRPIIRIVSFMDDHDVYQPASMIVRDGLDYVTDHRFDLPDDQICLENFDLQAFRHAAMGVESHCEGMPRGAVAMCGDFYDLAFQYGKVIEKRSAR